MGDTTNHPLRSDYTSGTETQYRVVGMNGRPKDSGVYSTAQFGEDALDMARHAQRARGGRIEARTITEWRPL